MTDLLAIARKRVAEYMAARKHNRMVQVGTQARFGLEDLAMAVAREYHEGEMRDGKLEQPTPTPGRDDSKEVVAV